MSSSQTRPLRRNGCLFVGTVVATLVFMELDIGKWIYGKARGLAPEGLGPGGVWGLLALTVGCYVLAKVVHEAGHLCMGLWRGLRPILIGMGPFVLRRKGGKLRLGRNRMMILTFVSLMGAGSSRQPVAKDLWWYIAGGPMASALFAAMASGIAMSTARLDGGPVSLLWLGWVLLAVFSALIAVLSLSLPGFQRAPAFDGARLRACGRSEGYLRAELEYLQVGGLTMDAVRYRDYPAALIADPSFDCFPLHRTMRSVYRSLAALDRGDTESALALSEEATDDFDEMLMSEKALVAPCRAFMLAWCAHDAVGAREWLSKAPPLLGPFMHLASEAAAYCAEEDGPKAIEKASAAAKALEQSVAPDSPSEWAQLAAIRARAKALGPEATP